MDIGKKLRALRIERGLSEEALSQQMGIAPSVIHLWEQEAAYPSLELLHQLCKALSVPLQEMVSEKDLVALARQENRVLRQGMLLQFYSVMDIFTCFVSLLPIFRQGSQFSPLYACTLMPLWLSVTFWIVLGVICAIGICEIVCQRSMNMTVRSNIGLVSVVLTGAGILLFSMTTQPYVSVILFLIFIAKVLLGVHARR